MDTWLEDFVAYLRYERNYSENTIKPYHDSLEAFGLFIKSLDSDLDWRHVTSDVIRDWIVCLMDRGITPSGVCPRLSAVKSFYRFLLRRGLVETDPAHMVQTPRKAKVLPYFVKEKDMNRLLDDVRFPDTYEGRRNRLIVMMLYSTGIRASELTGIDVDDVNLENCTITSTQSRVGGIAGYTDGNISGCTVSGSITGTGNVAGIVAYIDSGVSAPLTNCTFSGTVTATNGSAAGIVTLSNARIENCTNNGTIQGKNEVGGILAGGGSSPVTGCTNNGAVTGQKYIGGIVGISRYAVCTISDCTNNGHITATGSDAGGIAGRFQGYSSTLTISNCINTGTIEGASIVGGIAGYTKSTEKTLTYLNCSNSGSIISTGDSAGGLFGMVRMHRSSPSSPTTVLVISNSYNQGTVNGTDNVGGMIGQLLGGTNNPQLSFDSCFSNAEVSASKASPHIGAYIGYFPSSYDGQSTTGSFVFTNSFYSSVPGCLAVDGADHDGVAGAYKIIAGTGVTVTPSTPEDLEHNGVKYFVSGKSVTVTLSGGSSYSAVDGSSNTVALTDLGGDSYTLTMPASDVTISAN